MRKIYTQYLLLKLLFSILVITTLNIFNSCSDYAVAPSAGKINGRVYNIQAFPVYMANVSIGEYPVTEPDAFGNFHLDTKSIPYDLEVEDFSTDDVNYILFKSLTTTNPLIVLPFWRNRQNNNTLTVWVRTPSTQGHSVSLTFASKDDFLQHTEYFYGGDSLFWIDVTIPLSKTSIEGKVVFMLSSNNEEYTYDNYGEKPITLLTGTNDTIVFTRSDIQFDPPESAVRFDIILPDSLEYPYFYTRAFIHFPGCSSSSDIEIYYDSYNKDDYFIVPGSLVSNFNIKIYNDIRTNSWWRELWGFGDQVKFVYAQPGTSATIDNSEKISLISPEYNKLDVNENTLFSFTDNKSAPGVYIIEINGMCIVTDRTNFRFSELNSRQIKMYHNWGCGWSVIKLSNFNSIDEFVSKPFIDNENFTSIALSPNWYFKTAP